MQDRNHGGDEGDVVQYGRKQRRNPEHGVGHFRHVAVGGGDEFRAHHFQQAAVLDRADDDEQPHEEKDGNPLDFGKGVVHVFALLFRRLAAIREHHQKGGAGEGDGAGFDVQRVTGEETEEDERKDETAFFQQIDVGDGFSLVKAHDAGAGAQRGFQATALRQPQHRAHGDEDEHGDWRQVVDELGEAEAVFRADDDIGRVADEGRGTADV